MFNHFYYQARERSLSPFLSLFFLALFVLVGMHTQSVQALNQLVRQWHLQHPLKSVRLRRLLNLTHFTGGVRVMTLQTLLWAVVLYSYFQDKRSAFLLSFFMLFESLLVTVLKHFYGFERPLTGLELMRSKSYPSGHSSAALSFAVLISCTAAKQMHPVPGALVTILYSLNFVLTAYARIALDVHWLSDVLGGIFFALALLFGVDSFVGPGIGRH